MASLTTAFGYAVAVLLALPTIMLVALQSLFGRRVFEPTLKAISRFLPRGFGVRVRTRGTGRLNRGSTMIFMANHVNIFDPAILFGHIPTVVRAVELEDHFRWPIWGAIVRRLGNIPISHRNMVQALSSLERAAATIRRGTSIAILPEGHRTRNGRMGPFMRGPFRLALAARVDIVPMAINGAYELKNVHSPIVHPGTIDLVFGRPIPFESVSGQNERQLRDTVRRAIEALIVEPAAAG